MPDTKQQTRYPFKRFRREMYSLAVSVRDDASERVNLIYARKARVYRPYITAQALSRAKPKRDGLPGTGGPFGQLALWLAPLSMEEFARMRAFVDSIFDTIEAEKWAGANVCANQASLAEQEADSIEDVAQLEGHLTGRWQRWIEAAEHAIARARIAIVARQRELLAGDS